MPTKIVYEIDATATGGGRDGKSRTSDGTMDVSLAVPKVMGGTGAGVNPEQLFATGYAACFLGAMRFYGNQAKIDVPKDASVNVSVGIGPREDLGFGLEVKIAVTLPGVDKATAEDLIAGAHKVCPYSNAITQGLSVNPTLA